MNNESGVWVDEEFEALDLGDPRRDRRAKQLLKRFAAKPSASIPGACDGWTETMAAYRFLGNEEVEWSDMMQPHWDRTAARMQELRSSRLQLPGKGQFEVTCIVAREHDAAADVKPEVWRLVTNRLAQDRDAVIELIDWYRARREIEMFF